MSGARVSSLFVFISAVAFVSGCSSVPRVDDGNRGLFQKAAPSLVREGMPISLPSGANEKSDSGFAWPVKEGKVSSLFGSRKRDYHEGIDIRTNRGSPIFASKEGEVIYSSRKIRGYGNMIVVKHTEEFATVYAHNRKNLVKVGDHVTQGQVLGLVGATGKATGPHLHFEIRKGELPQDPLLYLPQLRTPAVASK
jgi:murein DD-endopeptidase MepM/ murein hydrolase activator NlpD